MIRYLCIGYTGPFEGYQSQGTNAKYLHFMAWAVSRQANRRNFARITCTPKAMALLSSGHHQRGGVSYDGNQSFAQSLVFRAREIEEKAFPDGLAAKPETSERLICYHRTCYSEHVHGDRTATNSNTRVILTK